LTASGRENGHRGHAELKRQSYTGYWLAYRVLTCRRTMVGYPHPWSPHYPGPVVDPSQSRGPPEAQSLVMSLGISLPYQVTPADLRMACTAAYRS
jgi:hypothetical protein